MANLFSQLIFSELLDKYWSDKQFIAVLLRSTGLYAKAGTIVEVTVAKELIGKMKVIHTWFEP